jgi:hypothetical protein
MANDDDDPRPLLLNEVGEMQYLARTPRAGEAPAGLILAHNNVRPAKRLGVRGFRAWFQAPDDRWVICPCPWAPEAGPHYIRREVAP